MIVQQYSLHHSLSLSLFFLLNFVLFYSSPRLPPVYHRSTTGLHEGSAITQSWYFPRIAPILLFPFFPHSRWNVFICLGPQRAGVERIVPHRVSSREVSKLCGEFLFASCQDFVHIVESNMKFFWIVLCVTAAIVTAHAKPTIYKRNEDNVFEPGERTTCNWILREKKNFSRVSPRSIYFLRIEVLVSARVRDNNARRGTCTSVFSKPPTRISPAASLPSQWVAQVLSRRILY